MTIEMYMFACKGLPPSFIKQSVLIDCFHDSIIIHLLHPPKERLKQFLFKNFGGKQDVLWEG